MLMGEPYLLNYKATIAKLQLQSYNCKNIRKTQLHIFRIYSKSCGIMDL